jgi:hypothetical protein
VSAADVARQARAEGFPPVLTAFQAAQLGLRFGVWVRTGPIGGYQLGDVAQEIADRIARRTRGPRSSGKAWSRPTRRSGGQRQGARRGRRSR